MLFGAAVFLVVTILVAVFAGLFMAMPFDGEV